MDKELVVLQKQINLHVADIERYQGFVRNLAIKKGETIEELRRDKEKARKTMKQLKNQKAGETKAAGSGQATMTQAGLGKTSQSVASVAFAEGSPVEILLFGFKKQPNMIGTSFNASMSTENTSTNAHVPTALKYLIKNQLLVGYSIATIGPDGRRLYSSENLKAQGGVSKVSQDVNLQTRIQVLLDQRKPPTEELPSLCDLYDDDLNPITPTDE